MSLQRDESAWAPWNSLTWQPFEKAFSLLQLSTSLIYRIHIKYCTPVFLTYRNCTSYIAAFPSHLSTYRLPPIYRLSMKYRISVFLSYRLSVFSHLLHFRLPQLSTFRLLLFITVQLNITYLFLSYRISAFPHLSLFRKVSSVCLPHLRTFILPPFIAFPSSSVIKFPLS